MSPRSESHDENAGPGIAKTGDWLSPILVIPVRFSLDQGDTFPPIHEPWAPPAGNNVGIKSSTGRYVMLLNSDTLVPPGALMGEEQTGEAGNGTTL